AKAPPTTGAISTTWVGSFRAKSRPVNSARLLGGSKPPVFQSSRPWKASVGTGPKKSIGSRSRISSGLGLSKRKPTLFSWVWLASAKLTWPPHSAMPRASTAIASCSPTLLTLSAAQTKGALKSELKRYLSPALLLLDEIGYLPIDQRGADLLFQVISQRYERGSIVLTSNKAFKQWATIFNGDSTITSAVLDRLLHHAETFLIEGSSYRMKARIES